MKIMFWFNNIHWWLNYVKLLGKYFDVEFVIIMYD
jgi:hypothetical protein